MPKWQGGVGVAHSVVKGRVPLAGRSGWQRPGGQRDVSESGGGAGAEGRRTSRKTACEGYETLFLDSKGDFAGLSVILGGQLGPCCPEKAYQPQGKVEVQRGVRGKDQSLCPTERRSRIPASGPWAAQTHLPAAGLSLLQLPPWAGSQDFPAGLIWSGPRQAEAYRKGAHGVLGAKSPSRGVSGRKDGRNDRL